MNKDNIHTPISNKECFMEMAKLVARRSKDPRAQNGAIIVSHDNRVLSTGYNGFPYTDKEIGENDELYSWDKSDNFVEDRLSYVVHAEANAILNFRGFSRELENSTIYVTQIPCNECAKLIVQSGIKNVIFLNDENKDRTIVSKKIMYNASVKFTKYE